jgi:hypothetical protein
MTTLDLAVNSDAHEDSTGAAGVIFSRSFNYV